MKIRISRHSLLDAVNKVKTVVSARSALPILSHILLETGSSSVRLSATDLKVSIECTVDCDVEKPGAMTVSSQRLSSILSELPNGDMDIELGENNVVNLSCGKIQTKLFSMAAEEFPPIRGFDGIEPMVLPQSMLKNMFSKTSFAISTDQARYNLTGLLFEISGGKLTVVATDGRRMSLYIENEGIADGIHIKVIVPGKMIVELERLLDSSDDVNVLISENHAAFTFGNMRLVTALIDGTFPNYDMVVPKKHDKEVVLDTARFKEAIRRTRTMTNDKFNSVRFVLESGLLTFKVITPEVGEYTEDMDVDYQGDSMEIAFNPDFVYDVLTHIETEKSTFVLKDANSPGVLRPTTEAPRDSYVNVIMPIRI